MIHRVIICDDNELYLKFLKDKVHTILENQQYPHEILGYSSSSGLLEKIGENISGNDIFLLDIDMPEVSGIDLAERIYRERPQSIIIFVTNRDDLVFQAIHYEPYRFVRKGKIDEELKEALESLILKMKREDWVIEIKASEGKSLISVRDMMYLESCKHYLILNCVNRSMQIRGKISEFEKLLNTYGFIRIHKSYLINVRYIRSVLSEEIEMDNGDLLPISRQNSSDIKKKCLDSMRRFVYGCN